MDKGADITATSVVNYSVILVACNTTDTYTGVLTGVPHVARHFLVVGTWSVI